MCLISDSLQSLWFKVEVGKKINNCAIMKGTKLWTFLSKSDLCWCLISIVVFGVLLPTVTMGQGIENSTMPAFNVTKGLWI